VLEDIEKVQREAKTPDLFRRDSRDLLHWMSCLESEKDYWGQDMEGGWEAETYEEKEKEETAKVFEEALEQSFGRKHCFFRSHWDFSDCESQMKGGY